MRKSKLICQLLLPVIAVLLVSCRMPSSYEQFSKVPSSNGVYAFTLDMRDSLDIYDLYLYSRFDCQDSVMTGIGDIPLEMSFISSEFRIYSENVYFPLSEPVRNIPMLKEYEYLYRSSLGGGDIWMLTIKPGIELPEGFCGFGIRLKRRIY